MENFPFYPFLSAALNITNNQQKSYSVTDRFFNFYLPTLFCLFIFFLKDDFNKNLHDV